MKIFKSKRNNKSYTIEILQSSTPFLDGTTRLGVYAHPYNWKGCILFFKSTDFKRLCKKWVKENFIEIAQM